MFAWLGLVLRRLTGRPGTARPGGDQQTARLGPRSEQLARAFLQRAGLRIMHANYRCPFGEIDIIARDGPRIVFVEVKARRLADARQIGIRPERAVTRRKQRKIVQAARYFCRTARQFDAAVRFDVIAIDWPGDDGEPAIRHHLAAFRGG